MLLITALVSVTRADGAAAPSFTIGATGTGLGRIQGQTWGLVGATVDNPTDRLQNLLLAVAADNAPSVQFACPAWLPPRSRQRFWIPIRPFDLPPKARSLSVTGHLINRAGGREEMVATQAADLLAETRLLRLAAVVGSDTDADAVMDMLTASRPDGGNGPSRGIAVLRASSLPALAAAYEGADQLVLGTQPLNLDAAQLQALHAWLAGGGRLWLLLDRMQAPEAAAVVGPDWAIGCVDRVDLNRVRLETIGGEGQQDRPQTFSNPVTMVRVVAPGWHVGVRVDGWPAALWRPVGRGLVLVTTLGARAWAADKDRPTQALNEVARVFNEPPARSGLQEVHWTGFLQDQIGYRIVSRQVVAGILAAFTLVLLGAGLVLWRAGKLEHIGYVGIAAAVITAGVVLGIGAAHRQKTPATMVGGATLTVAPDEGLSHIAGELALYSPTGGTGELSSRQGGVLWPYPHPRAGRIVRLVWKDLDAWSWENLDFPPAGVVRASFTQDAPLKLATAATVSFDAQGAVVPLDAQFVLQDPVVAGPGGLFVPRINDQGALTATPADVPPPGQFISAAIATQEQIRHQNIYRQLFSQPGYPAGPMLLGFSRTFALPVQSTPAIPARQEYLVALPLAVRRPAPGREILIPAPFWRFHTSRPPAAASAFTGDRGRRFLPERFRSLPIYDAVHHQFISISNPANVDLEFVPPRGLAPLGVQGGRLRLDISAPNRTVEVAVRRAGRWTVLGRVSSPLAAQVFALPADAAWRVGPQGGIDVEIRVGDSPDPQMPTTWRIRAIGLELKARVLP